REFDALLTLPGVGRYTAGAIGSIAFDQPTPILDGNVTRVLARVYGINGIVRSKRTSARLWTFSEQLVRGAAESGNRRARPCSSMNQALMELGAVVCTPKTPRCTDCPINEICVARRTGRIARLPNLGRRPEVTKRRFVAFVAEHQGRFLVRQRPAGVVN